MRTMCQFMDEVDVFECVVGGHNLFGMDIMEFCKTATFSEHKPQSKICR